MDLGALIRAANRAGRTYAQLEKDCGGKPSAARLQQLATKPLREFPDPDSVRGLARGLRTPESTVVMAAAESLGLDVTSRSRLADLLPAGDHLTDVQVDAVRSVVWAMMYPHGVDTEQMRAEAVAAGQRLAELTSPGEGEGEGRDTA